MQHKHRIAITGIGIVSPLGTERQTTWEHLMQARSGVDRITHFDASRFPTQVAAEVKNFKPTYFLSPKLKQQVVPFVSYALQAATEAFEDAGMSPTDETSERWGLVVGSGMMTAEFHYWQKFQQAYAKEGIVDFEAMREHFKPGFYKSADFCKTLPNSGLGLLLQHFHIRGYATSVHTACASGGQALGLALRAMRRGEVDYMLAGGFDSMINPIGVASFCLLGAMSTHNDPPEAASRPFDKTRNGFILGEGAAFLILESFEHAKARGARIYAELAGEGNSMSAYRITDSHPSGDGAIQAIRGGLQDAHVSVNEVTHINAHATGTQMNDLSETNAIKAVFGARAKEIPISGCKSLTGHLIAGAGALEAAITALSIYYSKIPMTAHLTSFDPACDLDYVSEGVRTQAISVAVSNSFGFGGSNSCLVFKHPEYEG